MDTLQIQIDHYKETCELQRESIKSRNRFFVYIWIDVFFLFLFVFAKTETLSAVQQWLSNQFIMVPGIWTTGLKKCVNMV